MFGEIDMPDLQNMFNEFEEHLLMDDRPSEYLNGIFKSGFLRDIYPFTMLWDLIKVPQSPQHHPEGNVWNHTLLVVDMAASRRHQSEDPRAFMWAALLHDLGKVPTTRIRKGKITAYDHDRYGEELAKKFLSVFTSDQDFINKVSQLVRWHMQMLFVVKKLPFADVSKMLSQVSRDEIALLTLCDRLGRGGMNQAKQAEEEENVRQFYECTHHWKDHGINEKEPN